MLSAITQLNAPVAEADFPTEYPVCVRCALGNLAACLPVPYFQITTYFAHGKATTSAPALPPLFSEDHRKRLDQQYNVLSTPNRFHCFSTKASENWPFPNNKLKSARGVSKYGFFFSLRGTPIIT